MDTSTWAIVFATLLGPILAVQIQKWLDRTRALHDRRVIIFRTLMATRATVLAPLHVEALNAIPIEFHGRSKRLKGIIEAWKVYLAHLGANTAAATWGERRSDLMVELLHRMSSFLGYDFNAAEIGQEVYWPTGHHTIETDQEIIRRGLARLFAGEIALPVEARPAHVDAGAAEESALLRRLGIEWLTRQNGLPQQAIQAPQRAHEDRRGTGRAG